MSIDTTLDILFGSTFFWVGMILFTYYTSKNTDLQGDLSETQIALGLIRNKHPLRYYLVIFFAILGLRIVIHEALRYFGLESEHLLYNAIVFSLLVTSLIFILDRNRSKKRKDKK